MNFLHESEEFPDLLDAVAAAGPLTSAATVEKDYWICHTLWALSRSKLEIWFKGGTSLSKGFRLTKRFSEDIDLVIRPGAVDLPDVSSWRTETQGAIESRSAFWDALLEHLDVPGARIEWDRSHEETQRNVGFQVHYPGHFVSHLESVIRPYVLLEISCGDGALGAVAMPVECAITSEVHEWLRRRDQLDGVIDNRPQAIACVHPHVTLLEKLDAITRRYHRADDVFSAASYARHYEDAAKIIVSEGALPPLSWTVRELAATMYEQRQIRKLVCDDDEAFQLPDPERRKKVEAGYKAIAPMFWGERMTLDESRGHIIRWLKENPLTEPVAAGQGDA